MLRKTKKQPETVAEKVTKLLSHPNDSDSDEGSDADLATAPQVVDFDFDEYDFPDARSTDFRKRNVKLLSEQSERYKGKISSRKDLELNDSESESDDDDDDDEDQQLDYEESDSEDEELEVFNQKLKSQSNSATAAKSQSDEDSLDDSDNDDAMLEDVDEEKNLEEGVDTDDDENDDDDNDDDDVDDDDDDDDNDDEEDDEEDDDENAAIESNNIMSKVNQQAEVQKGLCVQNQLRVWERLLELRINTQKITSKANQLPAPEKLQTLSSESEELQAVLSEAQERSAKLLQQLLALQSALTQQHSELRQSVKRKQLPENGNEPASKRFAEHLESNFQQMRSYRNEVLLKWDDRTKLLMPGAGTKRKSLQEDYDILKKINSALANRETLIEKTQTLKRNQDTEVEAAAAPRLAYIYDDSDFYHQQLRELIEYKAGTSSNMSEITKQYVELQKLRQKMKKKVDTRASKGRKLRYVVHNKLINFMAPNETCDWTEESKTELYKSLFV